MPPALPAGVKPGVPVLLSPLKVAGENGVGRIRSFSRKL